MNELRPKGWNCWKQFFIDIAGIFLMVSTALMFLSIAWWFLRH